MSSKRQGTGSRGLSGPGKTYALLLPQVKMPKPLLLRVFFERASLSYGLMVLKPLLAESHILGIFQLVL